MVKLHRAHMAALTVTATVAAVTTVAAAPRVRRDRSTQRVLRPGVPAQRQGHRRLYNWSTADGAPIVQWARNDGA